jgi:hypothetical protein
MNSYSRMAAEWVGVMVSSAIGWPNTFRVMCTVTLRAAAYRYPRATDHRNGGPANPHIEHRRKK